MKLTQLISFTAFAFALAGVGQAAEIVSFGSASDKSLPVASVFLGAKPLRLPKLTKEQLQHQKQLAGKRGGTTQVNKPAYRKGNAGGPVREPIQIVPDPGANTPAPRTKQAVGAQPGIGTMAYGESEIPFSTSRVELNPSKSDVTKLFPYRAAGRLGFKVPDGTATCSAALIDKGILLTAAHCVTEFGGPKFSGFTFIPGYYKGKGAYGAFRGRKVYVNAGYANGTDVCDDGVVCENDVAVIVLDPNDELTYPGDLTGWYGFGWDGYGFTPSAETHITQLGYPGGLDNARQMIRNDSIGYGFQYAQNNTVIGSGMDAGSSGGPWVANLGMPPEAGIGTGADSDPNTIIGVTSWGYDDGGVYLQQGASPFTSNNVAKLYSAACKNYPSACSGG